jgi:hypothetical protein
MVGWKRSECHGSLERRELLSRERQCFLLGSRDFLYLLCWVFFDLSLFNAKVEECYDALVLIVERSRRTIPGMYPAARCRHIELRNQRGGGLLSGTPFQEPGLGGFVLRTSGFSTIEACYFLEKLINGRSNSSCDLPACALASSWRWSCLMGSKLSLTSRAFCSARSQLRVLALVSLYFPSR